MGLVQSIFWRCATFPGGCCCCLLLFPLPLSCCSAVSSLALPVLALAVCTLPSSVCGFTLPLFLASCCCSTCISAGSSCISTSRGSRHLGPRVVSLPCTSSSPVLACVVRMLP